MKIGILGDDIEHDCDEIIPIWKEDFYDNPCGDRLGFLLKRNDIMAMKGK